MPLRNDRFAAVLILLSSFCFIASIGFGQQGASSTPPIPATSSAASQEKPAGQSGTTQDQKSSDQEQTPKDDNSIFVFKKQVEEVVVHATVVDDSGRLIMNLPKEDFTVFENGQQQTMTSFRHEDIPVAMGIVIDNSGSMREKREKVNKAALNLVRSSNPRDQVFVVNFNDEYYLD